jgi:hypothetical protein
VRRWPHLIPAALPSERRCLVDATCCNVLRYFAEKRMARRTRGNPLRKEPRTVRASVSLRRELYRTLEALARQKRVSTAWVLREAAEKYVTEQWPLFPNNDEGL